MIQFCQVSPRFWRTAFRFMLILGIGTGMLGTGIARFAFSEEAPVWNTEEQLQNLPTAMPVPEWKGTQDYPWSKIPTNVADLPEDQRIQEVIMARVAATTIDHLKKLSIIANAAIEKETSEAGKAFVQAILESSTLQQSDVILGKLGSFSVGQLRKVVVIMNDLEKDLRKVLSWKPKSAKANFLLAEVLNFRALVEKDTEKQGMLYSEVRAALDEALKAAAIGEEEIPSGMHADALVMRALLWSDNEIDKAIVDLDAAIAIKPSYTEELARRKLELYIRANQFEAALQLLNEEIRLLEEKKNAPPKEAGEETVENAGKEAEAKVTPNQIVERLYQARILQATLFHELHDNDKALEVIRLLRKEQPDNKEIQSSELSLLLEMDRTPEAMTLLEELIGKNPLETIYTTTRGQLLFTQGKYEEAYADAEKTLLVAPNDADATRLRLLSMVKLGRTDEAVADIRKILALDEHNFDVSMMLFLVFVESQRYQEIPKLLLEIEKLFGFDSLTKESPSEVPPRSTDKPGKVMFKGEELPGLDVVLDRTPEEDAEAFYQFGANFYMMAGKHKEAVEYYEKALKIYPSSALTNNNLAWLLCTSPDAEVRNADRAIKLATNACFDTVFKEPGYLSTLAAAYAEKGEFTTALEWIGKALDLATPEMKAALEKEKESYSAQKPFRERSEEYKY